MTATASRVQNSNAPVTNTFLWAVVAPFAQVDFVAISLIVDLHLIPNFYRSRRRKAIFSGKCNFAIKYNPYIPQPKLRYIKTKIINHLINVLDWGKQRRAQNRCVRHTRSKGKIKFNN